ncbi:hypothetical protein GJAV_G00274360, partial [Gymnothorax javanicus]
MVEAIFLELCRIHYEGRTIAGVRISRWKDVMRDYCLIRDNVHMSTTLMTVAPIQLFEVNHRTLLQWHTERSKSIMVESVTVALPGPSAEQTAAGPLLPARALLKEPSRPDQPMEFPQPEDASGLAATRRGPLAPELYDLISAAAGATAASSSDTAGTPAPCSTPAAGSTASSASAATSAGPPAPAAPHVPRSTAWQRKVQEEQQRSAQEMGALFKAPRRPFQHFLCKRCGQPKTKEFGHSRYRGEHFCSLVEGRSAEDWLAEKKRMEAAQTAATQPRAQAEVRRATLRVTACTSTCPPVRASACPPVRASACPPARATTCPPARATTCPPARATTCPPACATTCPPACATTCLQPAPPPALQPAPPPALQPPPPPALQPAPPPA